MNTLRIDLAYMELFVGANITKYLSMKVVIPILEKLARVSSALESILEIPSAEL